MPLAAWKDLCIDASDPARLAGFWGALLGLAVEVHDDGDAVLRGRTPAETIWVNGVPEPKTVKHRVHVDVGVADDGAARRVRQLLEGEPHHLDPTPARGTRSPGPRWPRR